jgi:LysM repeat protein
MRKTLITFFIVTVLLLGIQAGVGTVQAAGPAYHVVQPGQTLFSIAGMYGVSSWAMAYANGLWDPNTIYAGQALVVPYAGYQGYGYRYYNPGYFPVYNSGCCGTTRQNYQPTYTSYRPHSYGRYYTVCWGDTMSSIAWRYGVSPWAIANANHIYNLNWIYAGQQLYIPY